ncbi:MAG TPA: energy transducer TonB [Bryobacteraceae bacterium]|nr:energy transducer TonB [Bryobacteraceae bacterium]
MFDQTFVDGVGKTHKSWTVALSFGVQILVIGVLILIPLIFVQGLPKAQLVSFLQAPAPPPPPPPPPPPVQKVIVKVAPRQFNAGVLTAPKEIPKTVAMIQEESLPPAVNVSQVGVPGGLPGVPTGISAISLAPPPPPPPPKVVVKKPTGPVRVGGKVKQPVLIKRINPVYPTLAKSARIQGAVKFTGIIGTDGTIQDLKVVSGHPLLVPAALQAVKQWVYSPTLLNGEPVQVITEITVNFTLSQ